MCFMLELFLEINEVTGRKAARLESECKKVTVVTSLHLSYCFPLRPSSLFCTILLEIKGYVC